ncbi:MAG: molybdopterin-binding protein [Firmicutes bacterium]|nr:molybdopterin-binding protein [Bacillota bacterium]
MRKQAIKVEEAVGKVLSHDITKIVAGEFKGPAYKKGHVITSQDVQELLKLGKDHVYVLELDESDVHEDEAGVRLGKAVAGNGTEWKGPKESRVNIFSSVPGLLKINIDALEEINELPNVVMATLPNNTVVKPGDMLAGTKVIPLVVDETDISAAENIAQEAGDIIKVVPFIQKKVGIIVTGNEVYKGRIKDTFGPVLSKKINSYQSEVLELAYCPDDAEVISTQISNMVEKGAEMILLSGGMSVDPDDTTPKGIVLSGAEIIKYGAPALPGAMFLIAYINDIPILGVPACGMYFKTTVLDLVLPRIFVGEKISRKDIIKMAHGGLCQNCAQCSYPNCTFGMGGSL